MIRKTTRHTYVHSITVEHIAAPSLKSALWMHLRKILVLHPGVRLALSTLKIRAHHFTGI